MTKISPMINKDIDAQRKFATHVQSVAFNLVLSRRMIDLLQLVRDYGWPNLPFNHPEKQEHRIEKNGICRANNAADQFIRCMHGLTGRGLIIHTMPYHGMPQGEHIYKLSRAGEMVCELLVEAGLMVQTSKKRKQA